MNRTQLHSNIAGAIKRSMGAVPSYDHAKIAMGALDLTTLNDDDSDASITRLAQKSQRLADYHPSTLCVFPQFLHLLNDYKTATVVIFPSGQAESLNQIKDEIAFACNQGANEIDYVADYQAYMSMEVGAEEKIGQEIRTAKTAASDRLLKIILESAAFGQTDELYDFSALAIENGADFIKTSTGKHDDGGADMESVATMALAIDDHYKLTGKYVGLKISGGVNGQNYAQYMKLVENILGHDFVKNPSLFRFGASALYDDLQLTIETYGQSKGRTPSVQKSLPQGY